MPLIPPLGKSLDALLHGTGAVQRMRQDKPAHQVMATENHKPSLRWANSEPGLANILQPWEFAQSHDLLCIGTRSAFGSQKLGARDQILHPGEDEFATFLRLLQEKDRGEGPSCLYA